MERTHGEERVEGKCRNYKGHDLGYRSILGEYPWAVCHTGVGNNSIYCNGCQLCMHKKSLKPLHLKPFCLKPILGVSHII